MTEQTYDVTVIGAGPVGMYATFYAALRKLNVRLIDSQPQLGGQLSAIYPEKDIYDIPGYPCIKAQDLVDQLAAQIETVKDHVDIVLDERVETVEKIEEEDRFKICTAKGCHYSKTIIIAAGKGAFRPRPLGIDGEESYQNLHYLIKDLESFRNKRVAIFGGGDSAVDWANMLNGVAKEVYVIHRRNQFRAHEHSVQQMMASNAKVFTPYTVDRVQAEGDRIKTVFIKNDTGKEQAIDVDEVVVLFGSLSALGPIEKWKLELENKSLVVNHKLETNISGIFAIGDSCHYDGKIKMITTGFGEATIAVNQAYQMLHPEQKNAAVYSSLLKR